MATRAYGKLCTQFRDERLPMRDDALDTQRLDVLQRAREQRSRYRAECTKQFTSRECHGG